MHHSDNVGAAGSSQIGVATPICEEPTDWLRREPKVLVRAMLSDGPALLFRTSPNHVGLANSNAGPGGPRAAVPDPISWPAGPPKPGLESQGESVWDCWQAKGLARSLLYLYGDPGEQETGSQPITRSPTSPNIYYQPIQLKPPVVLTAA